MAAEDLINLFCAHLRELSRSPRTIGTYSDQLRYADAGTPFGIDTATATEIKAWIWRDGMEMSSRALAYASLVAFYRWAIEAGELDFDPTAKIKRPQVPESMPRVATHKQAKHLLTQAPEPYRLWAQLAAYGGLRCIEIWRLDRDDITEQFIRVHGKGGKKKPVPTHPVIWEAVKDLPPGPLTTMPDERAVSYRFKGWCTRNDMPRMSLHRLRGWFATAAYKATRDPRAVQRALRHTNLANTMRYIEWDEEDIQSAVSSLPVFSEDDGPDAARPARSAPPSLPPGAGSGTPEGGPAGPPPRPEPHPG
jgi:integrase/recombinase XerC